MKHQTVMKWVGACALLLSFSQSMQGQGGKSEHPDMSYLKSSPGNTHVHAAPVVTVAGYFDNLELAKKTPEKVVRLNLQGHQLKSVPSDLCMFPNLQELDLSNNLIKSLEVGFQCPTALKKLYVNHNQLTLLPAKLAQLTQLQVLVAYDNPITTIDPAIGTMKGLKELWLSGDGTPASLPASVWGLQGLETLRLWHFGLTQVPDQIAAMQSLKVLCLQNNHLQALNPKICALPLLNYLNLGKNDLHHLPGEVRQCTHLGYLGIFENPIAAFPDDFVVLSKSLERLSAWGTGLPAGVQQQVKSAFPKTAIMFEAINLH